MPEKRMLIMTNDQGADLSLHSIGALHKYTLQSIHHMHEIQKTYTEFKPHVVMLDLNFGDIDGVQLLNYMSNILCKAPIIIMGYEDERLLSAIKHIGEVKGLKISGILKIPLQEDKLKQILQKLDQRIMERIDATKLAKALEEKQFQMYYQPKIHIKSKQLGGLEALVRWKKSNGEMVQPMDFIPIAEESGLIVPLTHWIVRKVFEDCGKYNNGPKKLRFAINLSPKILNDIVFPDQIAKLASECKVDPENICFEITESGISNQSEIILEVLTRLRMQGFSLSIDDFGTGYSSIAELQRLPFNELKVDRSFVSELTDSSATQTIVRSTINLGHNLGMEVVAEGVETEEVMTMLENLECDISQGFLISKPLSNKDLEAWYDQHIDDKQNWKN